jgi:hypothetical protein
MPSKKVKITGTAGQGTIKVRRVGFKNLANEFKKKYGRYGNARQIKRLEDAGMDWVPVGSEHGYCTDSCFWWYENVHNPKIREIKLKNLNSYTDVTGSYIN